MCGCRCGAAYGTGLEDSGFAGITLCASRHITASYQVSRYAPRHPKAPRYLEALGASRASHVSAQAGGSSLRNTPRTCCTLSTKDS